MSQPIILFGAFDRHNFGDLLFPHIVAELLRQRGNTGELVFAGLAQRDLRAHGGHAVQALSQLAAHRREQPAALIHVGGEILTCDAFRAAVMLLPAAEVQATVAYLDARPAEKSAWSRRIVGFDALAPYTFSRRHWPALNHVIYNAVGGVDLDVSDPSLRDEVIGNLAAADAVGVRDHRTRSKLAAAGIAARLLPDPAVMVAELFGTAIRRCAAQGEVAQIIDAFPQGHVAVQFSADFGDDATLAAIAFQLDRIARTHGLGVAFFRAGAAPWHDDLAGYRSVAARMRAPTRILTSLDLWDIAALIAQGRAYCGSSLHGRIVAMAFGLPRMNLRAPRYVEHRDKAAAFAQTWEPDGMPATIDVNDIARQLDSALSMDRAVLERRAADLAGAYRAGFGALCTGLG